MSLSVFDQTDLAYGINEQLALITSILNRATFMSLVQVTGVELPDSGTNNYTGMVNVQPLVHQVDGHSNPIVHGTIYGLPYVRIQGGLNALIIDPKIGDIGLCVFANNDISKVKATKSAGLPGSARRNDWADGVYLGGLLNGIPQRYVKISDTNGIEIISTNDVKITAPTIHSEGEWSHTGNITATGTITGTTDVIGGGISLKNHVHINSGGTGDGGTPKP